MRSRAKPGNPPASQRTTASPAPAAARRLPLLLLLILPIVLGAALLSVALAPPGSRPDATDAATAGMLADAFVRGQDVVARGAADAPLARVLADPRASAAVVQRARGALGAVNAALADHAGSVALIDASGRARVAVGGDPAGAAALLAGRDRDLARVLEMRSGVLIENAGADGRSILFAAPVRAGGTAAGALVASVPIDALIGPGAATRAIQPADGRADAGPSPAATGLSGILPVLSRQALLALAALSLLAVPLVLLARRPARRGAPAVQGAGSTAAMTSTAERPAPAVPSGPPIDLAVSGAGDPMAAPAQRPAAQRPPAYAPPAYAPSVHAQPAGAPSATGVPSGVATASAASQAIAPTGSSLPGPIASGVGDGGIASPNAARRGRFGWARRSPAPAPLRARDAQVSASVAPDRAAHPPTPEELVDALTGLGNQRAFGEEVDRLMAGWARTRIPFAVLLIDVDDLKIVNARSGHDAGDALLATLGRHVRGGLRFSDRAFRIGGDEVALLLPHTDTTGAVQLGQRLLAKTRVGDAGPAVAFTAGAAGFPGPAHDRDQLLEHARAALAWGKAHGRASVLAYDPVTHAGQTDAERVAQAAAVAQVIAERSLRAVFQPIVDMHTGEVVGFEGLTRPGPGAPFTNPGALFEAAEAVGRTVELDAACFETIAAGARAIPRDRVVTINLSPRTMEAADFSVPGVLEVLRAHDLDPGRVILELTEREQVLDLDRLRDNLAELQRAGLRIAADDVGAGNAGLRLLSQFRFDIVKVDLALVQEGANNDASRAVLRSLRDLAQRWGAFVIAEGIETPTQLKVVRELGLAAGQGYLIGRPGSLVDLPPVDLDELQAGGMMLQNAPVPTGGPMPQGSPA